MRIRATLVIVGIILILVFSGCGKKDEGAKNSVITLLQNARVVVNVDPFAPLNKNNSKEDLEAMDKANETLNNLFIDSTAKKRILAALRLYKYKSWEILKTVKEPEGVYVVIFLRTETKLMGQAIEKRPGWRKALFKVEKKKEKWLVADLDNLLKKYGDKPFYNIDKE